MSFYNAKSFKNFDKLNNAEKLQQPIWGNEHFKTKGSCLYLKSWILSNIMYVKDLITKEGVIMSDELLYKQIKDKSNVLIELSIIKKYVLKRLKDVDCSLAPYVQIKDVPVFMFKNK